jgi:hypothetical protein
MAHDTRSANLSNSHDPAFQPSRTIATRYRLDPANATGKPHSPHYQATLYTMAHAHGSRLTGMAGHTRQAGRQAGGR